MAEVQLPSINWVIGNSIATPKCSVTLNLSSAIVDSLLVARSALESAVTDAESLKGGYAVFPAPRFTGKLWEKINEDVVLPNFNPMFMVYADKIYYRLEYFRPTLVEKFLYQDITSKVVALAKNR